MRQDDFLVPITENGQKVLDLVKTNLKEASQLMEALGPEEKVSLVSNQAISDPKQLAQLRDAVEVLDRRQAPRFVSLPIVLDIPNANKKSAQ